MSVSGEQKQGKGVRGAGRKAHYLVISAWPVPVALQVRQPAPERERESRC